MWHHIIIAFAWEVFSSLWYVRTDFPSDCLSLCHLSLIKVDAYGNILLTTLEMNNEVMPSDVGSSVSDSRNSVMSFDSSGVQFRKPIGSSRDGFGHHSLERGAMRSRANCRLRRRSSKLKLKIPNLTDVSTIDKWSRVIFPITFGFFNLIYWLYYMNWHTRSSQETWAIFWEHTLNWLWYNWKICIHI